MCCMDDAGFKHNKELHIILSLKESTKTKVQNQTKAKANLAMWKGFDSIKHLTLSDA